MKYMVMECHPGFAVVLDENGTFSKVANQNFTVGQTITEIIPMNEPINNTSKNTKNWVRMAISFAACFIFIVSAILSTTTRAYASVYMSINPAVQIDVDKNDMVINVLGNNIDGNNLIQNYNYKDKNLDTVMSELVNKAIDMNYLKEGSKVTITFDANEVWVSSHSESINQNLSNQINEIVGATIEIDDLYEYDDEDDEDDSDDKIDDDIDDDDIDDKDDDEDINDIDDTDEDDDDKDDIDDVYDKDDEDKNDVEEDDDDIEEKK